MAVVIFFFFIFYTVWTCASLVRFRRHTEEVLRHIEGYLKERHDLVTRLLERDEEFQLNIDARQKLQEAFRQAQSAQDMHEKSAREHLLGVAVEGILSQHDLKESSRWLEFKQSFGAVEERIDEARRQYNQLARIFNASVEHFPTNIFARVMGLKELVFLNVP